MLNEKIRTTTMETDERTHQKAMKHISIIMDRPGIVRFFAVACGLISGTSVWPFGVDSERWVYLYILYY